MISRPAVYRIQSGVLCLLIAFLVISPVGVMPYQRQVEHSFAPSYIDHLPINISGDEDFKLQGWPGNGTFDDPYVIANLNITTSVTSILIANTTKHFEICGGWFSASGVVWADGVVTFNNVTNGVIEDCYIDGNHAAITIYDSVNCTISGNQIDSDIVGLLVYNLNSSLFENNIQTSYQIAYPIHIQRATNFIMSNNEFPSVTNDGIRFAHGVNCTLENSRFHNVVTPFAGQFGAVFRECINSSLRGNVFEDFDSGIEVLYGSDNLLFNNTITVPWKGVQLLTTRALVLENEIQTDNVGIDLEISNSCIVEMNNIYGEFSTSIGVSSRVSNDVIFRFNDLHSLYIGIQLQSSIRDRIVENYIYDCLNAISLEEFAGIGYDLNPPIEAIIANNTFISCSLSFTLSNATGLDQEITGNTINGERLGFFFNESTVTLSGYDYGQIILAACYEILIIGGEMHGIILMYSNSCEIVDVSVSNAASGIYLYDSHDCFLNDISAENNDIAIQLDRSSSCAIYRSVIQNNTYGILLDESTYSTVYGCDIIRNYHSIVLIGAHDSTIESNSIIFNEFGLQILRTNNSLIGNNEVLYNFWIGIYLNRLSSGNHIIGNSFGWNGENAECLGRGNMWDNGAGRGNSWSDLEIGATVYVIDDDDVDRFPTLLVESLTNTTNTPTSTKGLFDLSPLQATLASIMIGGLAIVFFAIIVRRKLGK